MAMPRPPQLDAAFQQVTQVLTQAAGKPVDLVKDSWSDLEQGVIKEAALDDLRRFDHLINYMYLPPLEVEDLEFSMPESVALLYMPITLHHAFLEGQRISQLAYRGAQQLQRKLVWFYSGWLEDDLDLFDPPMD